MRISVFLITFNQEKYISESLYGILNQTRKPDQVVISDDCSKDSTVKLIKDFIRKNNLKMNWTFLESNKNLGIIKNLKKCFALNEGDIFINMAGDDISLPNRILVTEKIFKKNKGVSAVATSGYKISADGETIGSIQIEDQKLIKEIRPSIKLGFGGVFPVGIAYESKIINSFNKLTEQVKNEDDQLVFLSILKGGIICSKEKTFKYRIHKMSASSWLRDNNYRIYMNSYYEDLDNRINNFKNWIFLLNSNNSNYLDKEILLKKIEIYKMISKKIHFNVFKSIYTVLKNWNYLCKREKIQILFGPKLFFFAKNLKKLII